MSKTFCSSAACDKTFPVDDLTAGFSIVLTSVIFTGGGATGVLRADVLEDRAGDFFSDGAGFSLVVGIFAAVTLVAVTFAAVTFAAVTLAVFVAVAFAGDFLTSALATDLGAATFAFSVFGAAVFGEVAFTTGVLTVAVLAAFTGAGGVLLSALSFFATASLIGASAFLWSSDLIDFESVDGFFAAAGIITVLLCARAGD